MLLMRKTEKLCIPASDVCSRQSPVFGIRVRECDRVPRNGDMGVTMEEKILQIRPCKIEPKTQEHSIPFVCYLIVRLVYMISECEYFLLSSDVNCQLPTELSRAKTWHRRRVPWHGINILSYRG